MYLNTLSPNHKSKKSKKRLGRGMGSGSGKTCGRGHKGQNARSGGGVRRGFEGGQTPLYRRIPKFGFHSRKMHIKKDIRLSELNKIKNNSIIDIKYLKDNKIINNKIKFVKIIFSGNISIPLQIHREISLTKGAKIAIEKAGGIVGLV